MMTCETPKRAIRADLPPVVAACLNGLLRGCKEAGIPLIHLFDPEVFDGMAPIENRDYYDASIFSKQRSDGQENYRAMFVFLQQRLVDVRAMLVSFQRARDIQLDMISDLAAERNRLLERVKLLEAQIDADAAAYQAGEDEM